MNSLLHLCEEDQLSLLEVIKDYFHVPLEGDLSSCEDESDEDVEGFVRLKRYIVKLIL